MEELMITTGVPLMKNLLILIAVLCSFTSHAVEITTQEQLEQYILKSKFNGVVFVSKDDEVLMKKAYGYKNLKTKVPLSVNDRFEIGSNTKQIVAASLLKLQEEGKLSLNDKVTRYLPALTLFKNITIRNLLNHTSGISDYVNDHKTEFMKMFSRRQIFTLDSLIVFIKKFPLEFSVGTKWDYSNSGYILAGKILELVSGQKWHQYIKENFLTPLNMTNTGYELYLDQASDVSAHLLSNGVLVPFKNYNLSWALTAGALYSTVDDMAKWMDILDDSTLINEDSRKEMQTTFLKDYALGIYVLPYEGDVKIAHSGNTFGFASKTRFLKNSKLKVIVWDNIDGKAGNISDVIVDYFARVGSGNN
jgi:D-alanyl-D-alanine carboxypeptidase